MARVGEKTHPTPGPPPPSPKPKKKRSKVNGPKRLIVVQCWLTQGQGLDEEMQPIPSYRQNEELVHWWVLVHSGLQDDHKQCTRHLHTRAGFLFFKTPYTDAHHVSITKKEN
jgi:hypothetical protein